MESSLSFPNLNHSHSHAVYAPVLMRETLLLNQDSCEQELTVRADGPAQSLVINTLALQGIAKVIIFMLLFFYSFVQTFISFF